MAATERKLQEVVQATTRAKRPLRGRDKIGIRVGKVVNHYKVGKHFDIDIEDHSFSYQRNEARIAEQAALAGIYVVRTNVADKTLNAEDSVAAYKALSNVEQAFRSYKSIDLKVRPIHHHLADRVRAHVFLCMLAYYVEWHMRKLLAPILFDDDDRATAQAQRTSIVASAKPSPSAVKKARRKRTEDNLAVHSFQTLLHDLATIVKNRINPRLPEVPAFEKVTLPTPVQKRALDLLNVRL